MNKRMGFTLVEIAIVLVIIGLLLGGVLKGQELINSAKVKNLATDFATKGCWYGWVASPVVTGDLVLINASDRGIALDKNTGDPVWVTAPDPLVIMPGGGFGSVVTPVVGNLNGIKCVLFITNNMLRAVDLANGKTLWSYLHHEDIHMVPDPIVSDNMVFLEVTWTCTELDCSRAEPSVRWSGAQMTSGVSNPVLVDGFLYGTDMLLGEGEGAVNYQWDVWRKLEFPFRCVDWSTGEVVWEKKITGGASVIAVDGKLILLELDGTIHVVQASPAGWDELAVGDVLQGTKKPRIFPTPPAFCDGRIYCRNYAGDLVCVDARTKAR